MTAFKSGLVCNIYKWNVCIRDDENQEKFESLCKSSMTDNCCVKEFKPNELYVVFKEGVPHRAKVPKMTFDKYNENKDLPLFGVVLYDVGSLFSVKQSKIFTLKSDYQNISRLYEELVINCSSKFKNVIPKFNGTELERKILHYMTKNVLNKKISYKVLQVERSEALTKFVQIQLIDGTHLSDSLLKMGNRKETELPDKEFDFNVKISYLNPNGLSTESTTSSNDKMSELSLSNNGCNNVDDPTVPNNAKEDLAEKVLQSSIPVYNRTPVSWQRELQNLSKRQPSGPSKIHTNGLSKKCSSNISLSAMPLPQNGHQHFSKRLFPNLNGLKLPDNKDKHIADLSAKVQVLEYLNRGIDTENTCAKLKRLEDTIKYNVMLYDQVKGHFDQDSALQQSISYLSDSTQFDIDYDNLIRQADFIDKNSFKPRIVSSVIQKFFETVATFNPNETEKNLKVLRDRLMNLQQTINTDEQTRLEEHVCDYFYTNYAKAILDFSEWKTQIEGQKNQSTALIGQVIDYSENYWKCLRLLAIENTVAEFPKHCDLFDSPSFWKVINKETELLSKFSILQDVVNCCEKEIRLRLRKIEIVRKRQSCICSIDSDYSQMKEKTDTSHSSDKQIVDTKSLPSVLKFIGQSMQDSPHFKCIVIKDLFNLLKDLHKEERIYIFINPCNVLIHDGAILIPFSELTTTEPLLPIRFMAPECINKKEEIVLHLQAQSQNAKQVNNFKELGVYADVYSFGMMVKWLACVDAAEDDFVSLYLNVEQENELLMKMLNKIPDQRPLLKDISDADLTQMLENIFGTFPNNIDHLKVETEEDEIVKDPVNQFDDPTLLP